ncbi:UNVERIFIED_CONTAM: hypothetical protein Slati_0241100 [Sesamum latifolium]|uniref:Uncharacterized protein n=1 Tax=Sesamum latifolium TaxID=2727402 RepID=A0AAW2YCQ6_9LAMI
MEPHPTTTLSCSARPLPTRLFTGIHRLFPAPATRLMGRRPPPPQPHKAPLMCSYGGHIVPRPHDKTLCYVGETPSSSSTDTSLSDSPPPLQNPPPQPILFPEIPTAQRGLGFLNLCYDG